MLLSFFHILLYNESKEGKSMIEVKELKKDYIKVKRTPGMYGMVKSLFHQKKEIFNAVRDVSFRISDGEIVGYIGPNGAGKSTTIKMLTGILYPTSGIININGYNPYQDHMKYTKEIGVIFGQRSQLLFDLPVSDSYLLMKDVYGLSNEFYQEQVSYLTKILDLKDIFNQPVRTLSLGQRMKADIGLALLHNPKILYLDEPTIGLDALVKENIRKAILEINKKYHTTILLTTHDLNDIEALCNRVIIIDKGVKIYDGSLSELKNKYSTKKVVTLIFKEKRAANKWQKKFQNRFKAIDQDNKISVEYEKNEFHIQDIMKTIQDENELDDIEIKDEGIEDIIKKIYLEDIHHV